MIGYNEGIIQRVRKLVEESGFKKSRFALEANINPSNFGKKLDGKLGFTDTDIKLISEKYGVRRGWLMEGTGEKFKAPKEFIEQVRRDNHEQPSKDNEGIPLIPTNAMAGSLNGAVSYIRRNQED